MSPHRCFSRQTLCIATGIFALVILAGTIAWRRANRPPLPPLQIGYWYWHRPFLLTRPEIDTLSAMGVNRLYIHALTYHLQDGQPQPEMAQEFRSGAGTTEALLVLSFDYDVVRAFGNLSNADLSRSIATQAALARQAAEAAGLRVGGIQLDLDCPTRLLPKYADLLDRLRPVLHGSGLTLSVTALPTWLTSSKMGDVADAVDDFAPQFYEGRTPTSIGQMCPISDFTAFKAGIRRGGDTGRPFYAGIPAYGHALVFDGSGKLVGMYHDLQAQDAMSNPEFHYAGAIPQTGTRPSEDAAEEIVQFLAPPVRPGVPGPYHLVYDLPSPEVVASHIDWLRRNRPDNCRGVILYRYPEAGDSDVVPLSGDAAALRDATTYPDVTVAVQTETEPWDAIESPGAGRNLTARLLIDITNSGTANTAVRPGAVSLTVILPHPGISNASPGGFDRVDTLYRSDSDRLSAASPERSNVLRFTAHFLAAGQSLHAGPITLSSEAPAELSGRWSVANQISPQQIEGAFHVATGR